MVLQPVPLQKQSQTVKALFKHQKDMPTNALKVKPDKPGLFAKSLNPNQTNQPILSEKYTENPRTPPTYPFLAYAIVKERFP